MLEIEKSEIPALSEEKSSKISRKTLKKTRRHICDKMYCRIDVSL